MSDDTKITGVELIAHSVATESKLAREITATVFIPKLIATIFKENEDDETALRLYKKRLVFIGTLAATALDKIQNKE